MNEGLLFDKKPLLDSYLNLGPRPLSSFSFVSLFAWADFFEFEFKMIDESLCIFAKGQAGCFLYLPPLGRGLGPSVIEAVFRHMSPTERPKAVNRIENIPGNLLSSFDPGSYNQYLKPAEYVYRKEDLVLLKGNAYKSQRHDRNYFAAHQKAHSFGPYEETDFDACMVLYERWAQHRRESHTDEIYRAMLQENRLVHERLLKFYQELGLVVRVLKAAGEIIGYTFGFALDEDTFCVYAEIADLKIAGAAAFMFNKFCADDELKDSSRINTMDDFAMPNVARAKQAYHPLELVPSFSVCISN